MLSTTGRRTPATNPSWPGGRGITLTPVPGLTGTWQVATDTETVGTWQATDTGARLTDAYGECVAVVEALAGTQVAAVAGIGAHAQQWQDLAHRVLAGNCEISEGLPAKHEYRGVADTKYPQLVNPQCKCGELRVSGYVTRLVARIKYEQHVNGQ